MESTSRTKPQWRGIEIVGEKHDNFAPQHFVYVMPYGSNIAVARCGWDAHTMSNGKQENLGFCHCEELGKPSQ